LTTRYTCCYHPRDVALNDSAYWQHQRRYRRNFAARCLSRVLLRVVDVHRRTGSQEDVCLYFMICKCC
jgi:hypothetical protein